MRRFKTKTNYILICSSTAGASVLFWNLIFGSSNRLSDSFIWIFYAVVLTTIFILFLYPRQKLFKGKHVFMLGLLVPFLLMAGLSLTFGIHNRNFPDGSYGEEINFSNILDIGWFFFIYFHITTVGIPYVLGILISLLFVDSEPKFKKLD